MNREDIISLEAQFFMSCRMRGIESTQGEYSDHIARRIASATSRRDLMMILAEFGLPWVTFQTNTDNFEDFAMVDACWEEVNRQAERHPYYDPSRSHILRDQIFIEGFAGNFHFQVFQFPENNPWPKFDKNFSRRFKFTKTSASLTDVWCIIWEKHSTEDLWVMILADGVDSTFNIYGGISGYRSIKKITVKYLRECVGKFQFEKIKLAYTMTQELQRRKEDAARKKATTTKSEELLAFAFGLVDKPWVNPKQKALLKEITDKYFEDPTGWHHMSDQEYIFYYNKLYMLITGGEVSNLALSQ